ncbi:hypothetical protein LTR62_008529 [Meristemomyces frigidus]|uniref:Lytic polysaccharide monooxygenase n=1 Tax=Meristemomyces frigidus TaxID=1508187 RepID=A0AAN7TUL7_9PEZI|nr:hypothetical protein LTR62_008529 [Meristemomyces frigidus]
MLSKISFSVAALAGLLTTTTTAHMVITSPVPFGQSSLTNSPLINDGSDFPCKQRSGVYDITSMNNMAVGVPQTLAFKGGATHGGGSCQVSATLDKEPNQQSEWKVIHSIVGGCPSNSSGNLGTSADGTDATVFNFELPKGMPNGQYSLAWTWFNKIGNREMYMNCAPITVTGGADNNDVFNKLPDMFVINIPNEQCATVEGEDFVFPSPGDSAETPFSTALGSSTIGSGCASVTAKGAGSGAAGTAAPATASAGSSSATVATSAPVQPSTYGAATATSTAVAVTLTTIATVTGHPSAPASSAAASAPASSSAAPVSGTESSSAGSCTGGSVSCPNPGSLICISSTSFGLCDINNCAVPQSVAGGTTCADGAVTKRNIHARRHLAGRRSF